MGDDGIVQRAVSSLGKGFDLSSDFRLKYCKGDRRLILLDGGATATLSVPGFGNFPGLPADVRCDKGDRIRFRSDIIDFNQMSELFNRKSSVAGKIPSGLFNAMFGFQSGSWAADAADVRKLGLDGYFITLFDVRIDRYPLVLADEVRHAVPTTWDPAALARFIEKYGTHIIVGLSIGGQDVVMVKQDTSSPVEAAQLKQNLDNLGDQLFNGACTFSPHRCKSPNKVPEAFNVFDPQPSLLDNYPTITAKDGISVICSKRGGDTAATTHCEWLLTVPSKPDAIHFNFIPITSLLKGVPGKGFLSHAINLYLRYKPPIGDLQYFLDFQAHKIWAPIHNDLPLGPTRNKTHQMPALQFNFMGPKLYVNTTQVQTGNKPVVGMRLFLEGIKCNRLAVHLQHPVTSPVLLQHWSQANPMWHGSEEIPNNHRYHLPVQWKKFSHICTAPVKYDPKWQEQSESDETAFVVTGAQLHIKKHGSRTVLHLRLSYTPVTGCYIVQSNWMQCASDRHSIKSSFFSSMISTTSLINDHKPPPVIVDSGVYPTGPPVPIHTHKMLKFVDTTQLCRGPSDSPGHWLVTGAKLDMEKGKICIRVKFSLLNLSS